jgi:hypothetical protein
MRAHTQFSRMFVPAAAEPCAKSRILIVKISLKPLWIERPRGFLVRIRAGFGRAVFRQTRGALASYVSTVAVFSGFLCVKVQCRSPTTCIKEML